MMALLRLFAEAGIGNGFDGANEAAAMFASSSASSSSSSSSCSSSSSSLTTPRTAASTPFRPPKAGWPHKFLVFAHFRRTLDLLEHSVLRRHMPGVDYARLDGKVLPANRGEVVARFNEDPNLACLLLTTGVGGVGLNLTAADMVVFFEPDWNPMVDLQAMDRAHRIGQTRSVNVYRLITDHTLEEYMMDVQLFKTKLAKDVLGGVQGGGGSGGGGGGGGAKGGGSGGGVGVVPSGASRIGQVFGGGAAVEQQKELVEDEDGEYGLHAVEDFIQSLKKR